MSARVGDKVVSDGATCNGGCSSCKHPWTGTIATGAQVINGRQAARVTDTGPIGCPHGGTFRIINGSGDVVINGQRAARVGDQVMCIKCGGTGKIVSGSPDTFANRK